MEGPQILRSNGRIISLPPGFRFDPTDEELMIHYLKPKIYSFPLPADVIPEIDLRKYDPWDLPGTYGRERYLFNLQETKKKKGNKSYYRASSGSGYWKVTGKDQLIMSGSRCKIPIGIKRVLTFHTGRLTHGSRSTNWIMHEYRLSEVETIHAYGKWTICRIFRKNKHARSNKESMYQSWDPRGASDSTSSCITCLSDEAEQDNDHTSSSSP